ncbi:hypothetical protein TB2_001533 [Malus domestica]
MWKKKIMKSLGAKRVRNCHQWTELPDDVMISILSRNDNLRHPDEGSDGVQGVVQHLMKYDLKKMCRHAVDSSCGNLVEVKFDDFNDTATVLEYIADRYVMLS